MSAVAVIQNLPTPPHTKGEQLIDYDQLQRTLENASPGESVRFERKMGDTELSYFLPSRQSGVNDMYVLFASFVLSFIQRSPPSGTFTLASVHLRASLLVPESALYGQFCGSATP